MNNYPYDKTSKESIEQYAKKLEGKTFRDVINDSHNLFLEDEEEIYMSNQNNKGSLGNIIEKYYFMYNPNSNAEADFKEAGVELKVTPYLIQKNGSLRAKERLVLNMINYMEDYKNDFESSHMYSKCALILLIYYLYEPTKEKLEYMMNYIKLFHFPESDLEIIKSDYNIIIDKIKNGKAHEISEGDTNYLGACTKGANANSVRQQPFNDILAKQRAFCLKQSYMTYILNNYIIERKNNYESVIKDSSILKTQTLESYIINQLSKYYGKEINELKETFNITYSINNKSFTYILAKNMLNVLNDKIEEFEKANIQIKAIRLTKKGIPKESMSFPAFKYTEIVNETWENSELYETFSTKKYLFMIFQYNSDNKLIFKKAMFWNVPSKDLNNEIRRVWENTVLQIKNNQYNNLPKSSESSILHVRPHAQNSKDTYPTLDGKKAIKKCFWFNKEYIKRQIESEEN